MVLLKVPLWLQDRQRAVLNLLGNSSNWLAFITLQHLVQAASREMMLRSYLPLDHASYSTKVLVKMYALYNTDTIVYGHKQALS